MGKAEMGVPRRLCVDFFDIQKHLIRQPAAATFSHRRRLNVAIITRLFFIQERIHAGDFCKRRVLNYPQAFSSGRRWRGEAVTDEVFFHYVKCIYSYFGLLMISAILRDVVGAIPYQF
ncbi:MAG: hypothetical protein IJX74_03455 [Clostridia bacterium]|nr:hypothetical protein [Clostridia bacterium]